MLRTNQKEIPFQCQISLFLASLAPESRLALRPSRSLRVRKHVSPTRLADTLTEGQSELGWVDR